MRGLFALRDFRLLLVGQGASTVGDRLVFVALAIYVTQTGIALFDIWWHTALAQRVQPHMLSRVTSYDWMGSLALLPVGYVLAGPLGEALGATEVLAAGSVLALAALTLTFTSREVRDLRGALAADAPHVLRR
jgi:hypothetical protein